jgi:phosphoribosylamine--glycine ligase
MDTQDEIKGRSMKILVVGQGGREHALVWKLSQSPTVQKVFCAPGNAGTAVDGENVDIPSDDIERLIKFAQEKKIDLTVVGPEAPLVAGIVDKFQAAGLTVFGPTKAAAKLEGSKRFAKEVMKQANVPTAAYQSFGKNDIEAAREHLEELDQIPVVVKADGLAAGKGVFVCKNSQEALEAVEELLINGLFKEAGNEILIEERLDGEEASILAIVDGGTIVALDASQDHKRAHDGDNGPNTGGMGAYCPAPLVTPELMDEIVNRILIPTVHAMRRRKTPFSGVLYAGLMITHQGPKVIEYNVRFGDPEAQPVLMRLKTDLAEILLAAAEHRLSEFEEIEWDPRPAVCVVMASEGYPGPYQKGHKIRGLENADALEETKVFHAGTIASGDNVLSEGGRVLGVTAMGESIPEAKLKAYQAVKEIRWNGAWCRKDISDKAHK